jgi:Cof subfamily protein (haloacid dehalogenase superfamily)
VVGSKSDEVLLDRPMTTDDAQNAIRIIRGYGLYTGYYVAMQWFVEKECEEMHWERRALKYEPLVTDLAQLTDLDPHKLIVADLNDPKRLEAGYHAFRLTLPHLSVHYSGHVSFEVCDRRATKSSALAFLAKNMSISPRAILAIGDNFNDIDMFNFAGRSVAMGNAPPKVQASADQVVASNDQDGVAQAINQLLFE